MFIPEVDGQCYIERFFFALNENASVKLNTVYGNVVFNKNICTKQADPLSHVDKSIKLRKNKRHLGQIKMCD